jgi:hypothetical protein
MSVSLDIFKNLIPIKFNKKIYFIISFLILFYLILPNKLLNFGRLQKKIMINAILKFDSKVARFFCTGVTTVTTVRFFHSSEREIGPDSGGRETARGKERKSGGDYFGKKYFNFHLKLKR